MFEKIYFYPAICAVARPWHALLIGAISSAISISVIPALEFLKIDDPVGIIPIHLAASIWGMCAVGIFAEDDQVLALTNGHYGLIYSGSFKLLAIQMLCTVTVLIYSAVVGLLALIILGKSPLGIRVTDYEEQIGADVIEHGLAGTNIARYHIEKPLSSKTFATVTKAITKWKLQTRANRALREQCSTLGYPGKPDNGTMLVRQRKNKLSNDEISSLNQQRTRSHNSSSRAKMPVNAKISFFSNITKEGNPLSQQFRQSVTSFVRNENNMKSTKIDKMAITSKRIAYEEAEENPKCSKTVQSNFIPIPDDFTSNACNTLHSQNSDRLEFDLRNSPVQESRISLDHVIPSERRVLQFVVPNKDLGNTARFVTSAKPHRNRVLPLIPDTV
ncbi:unnamed protein product [Onchocerca ochengi]|uniref:Ammonium_transp domain-containing protein n=1 Tax=Onchocerca ochengi TaxID=42157 RepID=A0A182ELQ9_ONCOC|nr:unnamed protein product [Onchocerca ochengi]